MQRQYDDFIKLKIKDMSKAISDMTYKHIDKETNKPTLVPPSHYEKLLDKVKEQYLDVTMQNKFLSIMYEQLKSLKSNDEKYFIEALICLDLGIKPNDMRINEQVALLKTRDYLEELQKGYKKKFNLLNEEIIDYFEEVKTDPEIQRESVEYSNFFENELDGLSDIQEINDEFEI